MAAADYYQCDMCGRKTFYDADLSWDDETENYLGVGDMVCICHDCAKTYVCRVMKRERDHD